MNLDHEYPEDGSQAWLGGWICVASAVLVIWLIVRCVS